MAKNSGGTTIIVLLLIGAFALANSDGSSSSGTSSGSSSESLFGNDGETCDNATSFSSSTGTYVAPTVNGNDRGCVLSVDEGSGAPVQALQSTLATCYAQPVAADGDFGPATQSGLQAAQAWEHLDASGDYGAQTAAALTWPTMDSSGDISCQNQS